MTVFSFSARVGRTRQKSASRRSERLSQARGFHANRTSQRAAESGITVRDLFRMFASRACDVMTLFFLRPIGSVALNSWIFVYVTWSFVTSCPPMKTLHMVAFHQENFFQVGLLAMMCSCGNYVRDRSFQLNTHKPGISKIRPAGQACKGISSGRTDLLSTVKKYIYETFVDLVDCSISRSNHVMSDIRPSNCCVILQLMWPAAK